MPPTSSLPLTSFLDNDLYKFSMMHAVMEKFPSTSASYKLLFRSSPPHFPKNFPDAFLHNLQILSSLSLSPKESLWLSQSNLFPQKFIDYLSTFRFNLNYLHLSFHNNIPSISIHGPWSQTILFEVPLLALISQTYYDLAHPLSTSLLNSFLHNSQQKSLSLSQNSCLFADYGTRRRRSSLAHYHLLDTILSQKNPTLVGTSNLHLAHSFNITPIGTMAHEWIMAHAGLFSPQEANPLALQNWLHIFNGRYNIALTDTYTSDTFFQQFSPHLAHSYAGLRQDSGCPIQFTNKACQFYLNNQINPTSKKIIYSDSLSLPKILNIHSHAAHKIQTLYGIGTYLTNDFPDAPPLNIVLKLSSINNIPVHKITDSPEKSTLSASPPPLP